MSKLKFASCCSLLLLAGCAWSAEGLGRSKIEDTYQSDKSAQSVAGCIATKLMGSNPTFEQEPGHWVVVRNNGYGIPIVRWDVYDREGGGSNIEFRRSLAVMSGEEKAEACF